MIRDDEEDKPIEPRKCFCCGNGAQPTSWSGTPSSFRAHSGYNYPTTHSPLSLPTPMPVTPRGGAQDGGSSFSRKHLFFYGMELLVAGNIISLDLSIAQVYEQVWKKSNSQPSNTISGATLLSSNASTSARDCPPMTVTYRV